jgi:hypothetical protein
VSTTCSEISEERNDNGEGGKQGRRTKKGVVFVIKWEGYPTTNIIK